MIETDEGNRCFWIENQYLQNRQSSESNTNHFSYNLQHVLTLFKWNQTAIDAIAKRYHFPTYKSYLVWINTKMIIY